MGMSAAPTSAVCFASGHSVRVTPAEESITTRASAAPASFSASGSSPMHLTSSDTPSLVKPEAHQTRPFALAHASRVVAAAVMLARSQSMSDRLG